MSANIERLIGKQLESGDLPKHERLFWQGVLESYEEQRLSPEFLQAEWERQVNNFLDREFNKHRNIRQSRGKYKDSMPQFESQPEEYRGRLDRPGLVEGRIPWEEKAPLADVLISDYLRARIGETRPFNSQSKTLDVPYFGWFNYWGQVFPGEIAPFEARKKLGQDLIGAGPSEGIDEEVHYPEVTRSGKGFDLIGYDVESGYVPYLVHWDGAPWLDAHWGDFAVGSFRPLVRGSKIVTG